MYLGGRPFTVTATAPSTVTVTPAGVNMDNTFRWVAARL